MNTARAGTSIWVATGLLIAAIFQAVAELRAQGVPPAPEPAGRASTHLPYASESLLPDADVGYQSYLDDPLPPLDEELWLHGGSYLYAPEGDRLNWPADEHGGHAQLLRLPEDWQKPEPLTAFAEFLGADPIHFWPRLHWFGEDGFQWEPRLVGYGSYELFGVAFEQGSDRRDGIGQQLIADFDLRLTGTERFHMQFRPLGRDNSGGSIFILDDPTNYEDNSTGIPDRWWFEGELFSIFGGLYRDEFRPRDFHFVVGKFPFSLHNRLLINDELTGVTITKNTILQSPLSNLLIQGFYAFDEVSAPETSAPELYGVHSTADFRHAFFEATFAWLENGTDSGRDAGYAALSGTQFFGPLSLAGRALFKWGDKNGSGDGQLFVIESNFTRAPGDCIEHLTGIEQAVVYANVFGATQGWNSISGGNFDRLRSSFEVNPLVTIIGPRTPQETIGAALGVQLFRHHADESIIPEVAYEQPGGVPVWGVGLRYLRKTGPRTYLEARGIRNWSNDATQQREGIFLSTFVLF